MITAILRNLPSRCQLCHQRLNDVLGPWCEVCRNSFPDSARCKQCGLKLVTDLSQCGECLNRPPDWDQLYCAADYDFPIDDLLHKFKYRGQFWLANPLSTLLADKVASPAPLLLPVPMHWLRRCRRGYNQSAVLTHYLAIKLDTNWRHDVLKRVRATPAQRGLKRSQRLSNLSSAFAVNTNIALPSHVALVDDVVTTGSTVNTLSRLLKQYGVKRVDVYCLCRTAKNRDL
ncbi:ComF family protein [Veronia pacifica]|uniref:ComF family protein n=1 Tax=Veronia pacifica TaxID=1080227 RepID=UPI0009F47628|nr:ComF family protein [Veronia pacifica]